MPPKGDKNKPGKKTVDKAKAKTIEDKTFGLKNKKGSKQQKFIQIVEKQVKSGGNKTARQLAKEQEDKFARKDAKTKEALELNSLFRPVEQKIGKGVDPKSLLCAFFKSGQCKKGEKCKFSHDLNIGRKGEKRNIFEEEKDGMEEWTDEKLAEVVSKKHGEKNKALPTTSIICKHFLDAVENYKYGWFWACPGGDKCHYRHALPPGFQLKRDQKKENKEDEISLEELVEKERAALNSQNLTKVTLESFLKWKERKRKEKILAMKKDKDKRKEEFKSGKGTGTVSGREMFEFNPDLVVDMADGDDDDDFDLSQFKPKIDDEGDAAVEIDIDALASDVREVDTQLLKQQEQRLKPEANDKGEPVVNGDIQRDNQDESDKLDMAAGGLSRDAQAETEAAIAMATAAIAAEGGDDAIDIDENLFDDDDLLDVENELETLELNS